MATKKVVIRWDTKCAWNGKEQSVQRKTIDPPSPASLAAEQKIRVKFASRWYNAFVVSPWEKQRKVSTKSMQGQKQLAKSAVQRETEPKRKQVESHNEMEKAEKELEPGQPSVKRKKVASERELFEEYTDKRKKTELAWQRMRASGKEDGSKSVEKAKKEHEVEEGKGEEDPKEDIGGKEREAELEGRKGEEDFKRREIEIERREREPEEKKRKDLKKLEVERKLERKRSEEDIRKQERERALEERKREENFRRREMEIERRERELEEKKREDIKKLEVERELEKKKSEEDIRRREREQQQTREAEKAETDLQLKKLQDMLACEDDDEDGLVGAMDDVMQWPVTSTPIPTAWLPEARGSDVQNSYPSPWQVWNTVKRIEENLALFTMETRSALENLAERVGTLESVRAPSTPPSATEVPKSTYSSSFASSIHVPTTQVPTLALLTPSSKKTVSAILERTPQRHKAALKLLAVKFTKEELKGANCTGSQGKSKLDTTRLTLIRKIIFEKYPIDVAAEEREETVWKAICKRIDAKCRGTTFFNKF